jgi:KipI family sensor histidine kinase inhibitor
MNFERISERTIYIALSDSAFRVDEVRRWVGYLESLNLGNIIEIIPSFSGVAIEFSDFVSDGVIDRILIGYINYNVSSKETFSTERWEIKVRYSGEDLEEVAKRKSLSVQELIRIHSSAEYTVGMIGFTPGFPYLIGLPQELHTPRRAVPRKLVKKGAVAIGGVQAGIYPQDSPGGWHILGYTEFPLFDMGNHPPTPFKVGDKIKFIPI